jgi:hypothetical protein
MNRTFLPSPTRCILLCPVLAALISGAVASPSASAQDRDFDQGDQGNLVVSRVQYDGNTFGSSETYPTIFNDPTISGIQGSIHIDRYGTEPFSPRRGSLAITGATTSFSSKSEGALMRSLDGRFLTYMGYVGPLGAEGVSNSETPGATLTTNASPTYDRAVVLIAADGTVMVTAAPPSPSTAGSSTWRAIPIRP